MRFSTGKVNSRREGPGWQFAAGELAMTAEEMAKWNNFRHGPETPPPASYRELKREAQLNNGMGTRYGLGVRLATEAGHRAVFTWR